jgi:hypothetical protein
VRLSVIGAGMQKIINPTITFIKPNRLEIDYIPSVVVDEDLEGLFGVLNSRVQSHPNHILQSDWLLEYVLYRK